MSVLETIKVIWENISGYLQWIVPSLVILIIVVILASMKRGMTNFVLNIREIFSSKWWAFIFFILLFLFAIFWNDFRKYRDVIWKKFIDSFFNKFDSGVHLLTKLLDAFFHVQKSLMDILSDIIFKTIGLFVEFTKRIYKFFRWSTIPINFIIVRVWWLWYIFRFEDYDPLRKPGVHYIRALPGGGKSLLGYQLANTIMDETGYSSYISAKLEKPKITPDGKYYYVNHQVIDIKSYYKNGKKVKRFNTGKI